jgi:hypothetical protein
MVRLSFLSGSLGVMKGGEGFFGEGGGKRVLWDDYWSELMKN